nr:indolepyruvate ferredoxin oxidoreductase family protein [Roseibium sp. CAU 1639]
MVEGKTSADVSIRAEMLAVTAQDRRMVREKLPQVHEFTWRNGIDKVAFGERQPTNLGIVTSGKAFQDVIDGLRLLGIDEEVAKRLGVGVLKIGLIWPLDPEPLTAFGASAKELLFVEEKRPHMELQAANALYHLHNHPAISGKRTPGGDHLLPSDEPLDAATVAQAISQRLLNYVPEDTNEVASLSNASRALTDRIKTWNAVGTSPLARRPVFCSGCPHNRSTKIPKGSFGVAGIGCHGLVQFMDRDPLPCTHMGAEGVNWVGLHHFTETKHLFVNLGDGTFSHSGSLAIRAAASSSANVTFKILANDIVAMTGGQTIESGLSVGDMVRQVMTDGAKRVVVVAEDPESVRSTQSIPPEVQVLHRTKMESVQSELRDVVGTTVIVYVQVCATEKRKRRKQGKAPQPATRVVINPAVCEGCGDCSKASNCMSVQPLETEFGRKRRIDQASCNVDMSCLEGFCPSFVSIEGGKPRKPSLPNIDHLVAKLPLPKAPPCDRPFGMLLAGIGGTGVVTASAIVGMAAHLERRGVGIYDMTGLSQKGGAVYSHLRIFPEPGDYAPFRLGLEDADLLIASDLIAATQTEPMKAIGARTQILADPYVPANQTFHDTPDIDLGAARLLSLIESRAAHGIIRIPATSLAQRAFGEPVLANLILIGAAVQSGRLPLSTAALEQAIRLNGAGVDASLQAFRLGRVFANDTQAIDSILNPRSGDADLVPAPLSDLDARINLRANMLNSYQNEAYASVYRTLVERVRKAESAALPGSTRLTEAVAEYAFKLMAYKDEYEVARLLSDATFWQSVNDQFEGGSPMFHLAPPFLFGREGATGRPRKRRFPARLMLPAMRWLARGKRLRGTAFDLFGYTEERRTERRLRDEYFTIVESMLPSLHADCIDAAVALASYPDEIRGYGPVKDEAVRRVETEIPTLKAKFANTAKIKEHSTSLVA